MLFILHWGEAAACKLAMSGTIPQKCLNKIKLFYDVVREGLCHVFVRDFFFPDGENIFLPHSAHGGHHPGPELLTLTP